MRKGFYRIISTLGFIMCLYGGFSYGQSNNACNACGSTPQAMQLYIDMATQILGTIQTQSPEGPTVGLYDMPGLFGGGVLQLDNEARDAMTRAAEATARSINQKIQATLAVTTVLFTNVRDMPRDNFLGLALLSQNQAIVRDWAKLQKLGSIIQDKIFELALATAWQGLVTTADQQQITTILTSYKDQGILSVYSIEQGASYANIMFVLQKINRSYESFLSYGGIGQLSNTFSSPGGEFVIRLNIDKLQQMQDDYRCVRFGDQCAGNFKQFVTDMKTIGSENVQAIKTSGKDMTDAMKKLKGAFQVIGKQTTNFFKKKEKKRAYTDEEALTLSRQDQLLRTVYGSDFKRMQNAILPTIRANISRESFEEISQNMMGIAKAVNNNIVDPFKNIDNPKTYDKLNDKTPAQLQIATSISSIIDYTMQEVYKNHVDMMSMVVTIDPNHLTVYVPLLVSQLDTIRGLIGTKDTKGMIIHNLGTACELQCGNAGGTCRW